MVPKRTVEPGTLATADRPPKLADGDMERHFHILGVDLTLSGPAEVLEPIAFAYRRFAVAPPDRPDADRLCIRLTDSTTLRVGDRELPLVPGLDPAVQFYQRLQAALMDAVESWAVLHAAALADGGGGALLLAGPSGHGKTSLTLELVRRGRGFLSDDIAPLDLDESLVSPYHRVVAVVPGAHSIIPEPFLAASRRPSTVRWCGKALLDVGQILGETALVSQPTPLRHVLLLAAGDGAAPTATVVELAARAEDARELDELFDRTRGAEVLDRRTAEHLCAWRLRLHPEHHPTERLSAVFDSDRVVLFEKQWDASPDFATPPEAKPVRRREAAEMLAREMLNRRSAGRLLQRYGGSRVRIFVDLAGALRDAACWRIRVGGCRETADLVEQLVRSA